MRHHHDNRLEPFSGDGHLKPEHLSESAGWLVSGFADLVPEQELRALLLLVLEESRRRRLAEADVSPRLTVLPPPGGDAA